MAFENIVLGKLYFIEDEKDRQRHWQDMLRCCVVPILEDTNLIKQHFSYLIPPDAAKNAKSVIVSIGYIQVFFA